jgi:putative phosphoribosyl transferase
MNSDKPFTDRRHAGRQLALALQDRVRANDALVLALPRGGVPVGFAVARALALPLDLLLVRKLGLPSHEEFAMGAVGSGGVRVINPDVVNAFHVTPATIDAACERALEVIAQRERQYRGARPPLRLGGRTAVIVDDGLATGATMRAAIAVASAGGAASIVVAVPVGSPDACAALRPEVDHLVCLLCPPDFRAVSLWYQRFDQTSDSEVQDLLAQAWQAEALAVAGAHA